jgi:hypothetical protein
MLELKDTRKLFYGKYIYRVEMYFPHCHYFRNKNFNYAREALDSMQKQYEENGQITEPFVFRNYSKSVSISNFHDLKRFYNVLKDTNAQYLMRIESPYVNVYSNDLELVNLLTSNFSKRTTSVHQPKNETHKQLLLKDKNIIFTKSPSNYEYKLDLRVTDPEKFEHFISYCKDKDSCSTPSGVSINSWYRTSQRTLYLKNKKSLSFISLFDGFVIQKIYKLVYKLD